MRDQQSNLIHSAHRSVGDAQEYEFTMPLKNADQGDTLWERDQTYVIGLLVGPDREYKGVSEDVWMSDQVLIRIGGPSTLSMYTSGLAAGNANKPALGGSHGH